MRLVKAALLSLGVLCALGAVAVRAEEVPRPAVARAPAAEAQGAGGGTLVAGYLLQPGDMITVSVWKEQELQGDVLVRPDGGISFPLAGDMLAAGSTVQQLAETLKARLVEYIPKPVVTVALKIIGGNRIYVLGKVNRPGEFPFAKPIDVMQAIALAGGTTSYAELNDIQILRRDSSTQRAIPFRYGDIEHGRNLGQNVLLQSGDTVVVP
jgi:polysaccharide export outer membrane protein